MHASTSGGRASIEDTSADDPLPAVSPAASVAPVLVVLVVLVVGVEIEAKKSVVRFAAVATSKCSTARRSSLNPDACADAMRECV